MKNVTEHCIKSLISKSNWFPDFSVSAKNIPAHLYTVISDRVKRTKEEVLLNPYPVFLGVSTGRDRK